MTVQEDNQISLTDDLYIKDIEVAEAHRELRSVERRIHTARTAISAAKQETSSNDLYNALEEEKLVLTSMLDWISDLLFYLGGASEDVEERSQEDYKALRDLDNVVLGAYRVDLRKVTDEILKIRQDLLRLSGVYYARVDEVKPCMQIYEILIEAAREAVYKTKTIRIQSFTY